LPEDAARVEEIEEKEIQTEKRHKALNRSRGVDDFAKESAERSEETVRKCER
jgi:hypothetical protein